MVCRQRAAKCGGDQPKLQIGPIAALLSPAYNACLSIICRAPDVGDETTTHRCHSDYQSSVSLDMILCSGQISYDAQRTRALTGLQLASEGRPAVLFKTACPSSWRRWRYGG